MKHRNTLQMAFQATYTETQRNFHKDSLCNVELKERKVIILPQNLEL
jgi:hypothetical protein